MMVSNFQGESHHRNIITEDFEISFRQYVRQHLVLKMPEKDFWVAFTPSVYRWCIELTETIVRIWILYDLEYMPSTAELLFASAV